MRIPNRIIEHPIEALIAGALLLGLLFGSADHHAAEMKTTSHIGTHDRSQLVTTETL